MSHIPNSIDIKTDFRRAVMASFSLKKFADTNFLTFFNNAQQNLEFLKDKIGKEKYTEVMTRVVKSKDTMKPIEKRREDLLTASSLI